MHISEHPWDKKMDTVNVDFAFGFYSLGSILLWGENHSIGSLFKELMIFT